MSEEVVAHGTFAVGVKSLDEAFKKTLSALRPYYLVNKTSKTIVAVRFKKTTDANWGSWIYGSIGTTCTYPDSKLCAKEGRWVLLTNLECGVLYDGELVTSGNEVYEGKNLMADCNYGYGWAIIDR